MEKVINIKSPTGCVHRAIISRFSVKGSYKTLCNHTTPSPGGLGWHNNGYHAWPETNEEVTCKRCLKELRPELEYGAGQMTTAITRPTEEGMKPIVESTTWIGKNIEMVFEALQIDHLVEPGDVITVSIKLKKD